MTAESFPGRLGLQQRVLPSYRIPVFKQLASACEDGLSVFAGEPRPEESIVTADLRQGTWIAPAKNLHLLPVDHPLYVCWQRGIIPWLKAWNPEVLIAEANPRYLATRRAIAWMHRRNRPVIGWGLGAPSPEGVFSGLRRRTRERFLRSFDTLIAYSHRGAAEYRALGFSAGRIFVAPNAIAPPPTRPPPNRPPEFKDRPSVLFVGRLQSRKRVDILLAACAALPAPLQPRLRIVGDGPARAEFQRIANAKYPKTEFLGSVYGQDLAPFFEQADLFVLPGTGGLAVQEAMAHGLPVIVSEGDGTQEDLVHPENGWLVQPGDPGALAEALKSALSDPPRLRRMGAASYRIVREEINTDAMVTAILRAARAALRQR